MKPKAKNVMKKLIKLKREVVIIVLMLVSTVGFSQGFQGLDKSPHDITYYRQSRVTKPLAKVIYGRPSVEENSKIFGTVVPFDELWRTGANEATEVKFYKDIFFGNTPVKAGTYVLYTIPGETEWEVILSSNTDVLGAFQYDPLFDVAKIKVSVSKAEAVSTFSIAFKKLEENNLQMVLAWGSTRVKIPIAFKSDEFLANHVKKPKQIAP